MRFESLLLSVVLLLLLIHRSVPTTFSSKYNSFDPSSNDVDDSAETVSSASFLSSASADDSLPSPFSSEAEENSSSEEEEFVENVAAWRPRPSFPPPYAIQQNKCQNGKFFDAKTGECRACSICGPDLYEREKCRSDRDTVCEWCLTNLRIMVRNADFRLKCEQLIALRDQFRSALTQRSVVEGKAKPTIFSVSMLENASKLWKIELFVEMAFYITLIALVLAVIRFLVKSRSTTYRTVTVTPPMLEEWEQKNIVRAAESIREKMGGKGYAKLEEEFI